MLSGELAVEPSNAGTTGILNLKTRQWSPEFLDMAGLKSTILAPVKETGSICDMLQNKPPNNQD